MSLSHSDHSSFERSIAKKAVSSSAAPAGLLNCRCILAAAHLICFAEIGFRCRVPRVVRNLMSALVNQRVLTACWRFGGGKFSHVSADVSLVMYFPAACAIQRPESTLLYAKRMRASMLLAHSFLSRLLMKRLAADRYPFLVFRASPSVRAHPIQFVSAEALLSHLAVLGSAQG